VAEGLYDKALSYERAFDLSFMRDAPQNFQ
jgi:hypothetical protein